MTNDIPIYNPLPDDFSVKYDTEGIRSPQTITIEAGTIKRFPPHLAEHITKHLATKMFGIKGYIPGHNGNAQAALDHYRSLIEVKHDRSS